MALIKMSSIGITNLSGKAGGSVYSRNRGGSYIKNFVMPSNPQTSAQAAARAQFGAFASNWRQLKPEERTAWKDAAQNFPYTDRFGDSKVMSGENLYISLNRNLQVVGEAAITTPPAPEGVDGVISALPTLVLAADGLSLESGKMGATLAGNTEAETLYAIYATVPVSAGVSYVKNKFRLIGFMTETDVAASSGFAFSILYAGTFPLPQDGNKIFVRLDPINKDTGERGASFSTSFFVSQAAV